MPSADHNPVAAMFPLWIMAAPALAGITSAAADSNHLTGAVVVSALAEVGRTVRFLNTLLGLWIIGAPG